MKRLTTLFLVLAFVTNAFSQHWYSQDNQFIYTQKWFGKLLPTHVTGFRTAIAQRWHPVNNVWINTLRHANQYVGTNNVPQSTTIDVWNETTNVWKPNSIVNYNFTNNVFQNQVIQTANAAGVYTSSSKELNVFGANNQLVQVITQGWNTSSNTWVNAYRDTNEYRNNRLFILNKQPWSSLFSSFYDDARDSLVYDINGKIAVNYQQALVPSGFQTAQRNVHTYDDATGRLMELRREFAKDVRINSYDTIFRWTYTYNPQDNIAVLLRQQWSATGRIWQNHSRVTNTYNASGKLIQELVETPNSATWTNVSRTLYDEATDIQSPVSNAAVTVYPNPTFGDSQIEISDKTLTISTIQLFNSVGQLLYTLKVDGNNSLIPFAPKGLTQGVYTLKMETSKGILVKKWMKL
jgi:hypothetical protein